MLWNCGERLDRSATPMRHGPCDIAARFALTPNHVMPGGESGRDASQTNLVEFRVGKCRAGLQWQSRNLSYSGGASLCESFDPRGERPA